MDNRIPTTVTNLPIAIVGAACRLPGAPNVEAFWKLLVEGRNTVTEIPPERFPVDHWYDPEGRPGGISSRAGGFLDDVDQFDAGFFRISPHEADRMDPQHRLLMEVTWDALEDAGLPAASLAGSRTGVYTCCLASDYWDRLRGAGAFDMHAAVGGATWGIPAGRIAYHLDAQGPSMGVEAACATSMMAVHVAVSALRLGQIDVAVVGAANLLLSPDFYLGLSDAQILSPDGRSKFGDAEADGYVRSEGVVTLVLKPLPAAVRDGDRIYATILGTAINNNGQSAGTLFATSRRAQVAVMNAAFQDAGITADQIDYVEAHGPGTPGGDATEALALAEVMAGRRPGRPCLIGSVKSNLGHTEVSAGMVGLLKTALALRHRTIPASLHVNELRPELASAADRLQVSGRLQPWPRTHGPARAGVSSAGLGGFNGHVVLQEPPPVAAAPPIKRTGAHLLPLSARSANALQDLAHRYADVLDGAGNSRQLQDVCHSAGSRRTHHPHRLAVVGRTGPEMAAALRAYSQGHRPERVVGGDIRADEPPRVVFLFSGHGSQWVGMGRSLMRANPVFARTLRKCSRAIEQEAGWSLLDRLQSQEPLETVEEVQPALWAMQCALAAVWRSCGIDPDVVVGHSMGEVAAAVVSGALTVTQGAEVICRRATLIKQLALPGVMWAVQLGADQALEAIGGHGDRVSVAAANSPHTSILSGDAEALAEICHGLERQGVFCRQVRVDYASHAPHVEPIRVPLRASLRHLEPRHGDIPFHSTVVNRQLPGTALDAEYWMDNVRLPVRFGDAVAAVADHRRPTVFIEVSPHPMLLSAVEDTIDALDVVAAATPSTFRDRPEVESLLTGIAELYVLGCTPDWRHVSARGSYVPLPGYPWQRRRYWIDGQPAAWLQDGPRFTAPARPADPVQRPGAGAPAVPVPVVPAPAPVPTSAPAPAPFPAPFPAQLPAQLPVPVADGRASAQQRPAATAANAELASPLMLLRHLVICLEEALGIPPGEYDPSLPPNHSGLDSLLATHVSRRVRRELGLHLPVRDLLGTRPMTELAQNLFAGGTDGNGAFPRTTPLAMTTPADQAVSRWTP